MRTRALYKRVAGYLESNYPPIMSLARFARWSLATLRRTFFGIGGVSLLVVVGLYIAGALIGPLRWYLVGSATALLLLGGGLLALSYGRSSLNQDFSVLLDRQLDELEKRARWRTLRDTYRGQRAFLIGNGPSLNRTPLHLLKDEFTLCFNRFDLMFERLGWRPTMYMCYDDRVAEDTASRINQIVPLVRFAFFPDIYPSGVDFRRFIKDADNVFWLSLKLERWGDWERFRDDLPRCGSGGSVTYAGLQVLAFMGFSPIYLVGVDMDYKDHKTAIKHDRRHWTATHDDDPNHFDPRYFGTGARYHHPRLYRRDYRPLFQHAKEHLDEKGVEVLNAGIGGAMEVFPRVDFRSLFNFEDDVELEMLLDGIAPELRQDAPDALRGDKVIEVWDNWDEKSPLQVTTLQLAEQLISKIIFTHIPYGPFGNRYLFIRRDNVSST